MLIWNKPCAYLFIIDLDTSVANFEIVWTIHCLYYWLVHRVRCGISWGGGQIWINPYLPPKIHIWLVILPLSQAHIDQLCDNTLYNCIWLHNILYIILHSIITVLLEFSPHHLYFNTSHSNSTCYLTSGYRTRSPDGSTHIWCWICPLVGCIFFLPGNHPLYVPWWCGYNCGPDLLPIWRSG